MIQELEEFFKTVTLPETFIVNAGETIMDIPFFIKSHFRVINNHPEAKATQPFIDRLIKVKDLLSK